MAADASILKEYLIALGFRVDDKGSRKVENTLQQWDKRATRLTQGLGLVAVAAQAMVTQFASSMEKLYYSSKRTDSAVSSIQALEYGASRIGLGTGVIRQSLEAMSRNMRANPGLQGLLNSLGVSVTGRDKADVLTDLVGQLKKMPFYVAEKYANLFGIDPDTLFMLQEGLAEMKAAGDERKRIAAEMGVDSEQAARNAVEYNNQWRELVMRAGLFRDVIAQEMLPAMLEFAKVTALVLQDWAELVRTQSTSGSLLDRFLEGIGAEPTKGGVELSPESRARLGQGEVDKDTHEVTDVMTGKKSTVRKNWVDRQLDKFGQWGGAKRFQRPVGDEASVDAAQDDNAFKTGGKGGSFRERLGFGPSASQTPAGGGSQPAGSETPSRDAAAPASRTAELFARLEKQYAIPPGTLDRIWKTESNRGDPKYMKSDKGAEGHFGFMPGTAKEMGVKDPYDLEQSAAGSARYFAQMQKKYDGNPQKAAAAYNWGPGNLDKFGLGRAPKETRDYIDKVAPAGTTNGDINQTNNITINGVSDPRKAADLTREQMNEANADTIRNMKARVY